MPPATARTTTATAVTSCVNGVEQNSCAAGSPLSSDDATCDGKDDNCDGSVDENYAPSNTSCGTGVCVSTGVTSCVNGVEQNSCAAGSPLSSDDATCDGKDDNCDGSVDENYAPSNTSCGTGVCVSTGVTSCVNGVEQNSCVAGDPLSSDDATCDGKDDNCDGSADEDYAPSNTSCGTGVCASTGVTSCVNGVEQNSCAAGSPLSSDDATCDGKDDNCDGSVDENYAPSNTSCGTGVCVSTGVTSCVNGVEQNSCVAGDPLSSDDATCDGKDDNCDGSADEDYAPSNTSCGTGVCASTGVTSCVNGVEQNSCAAGSPLSSDDATCDGKDDNCDGSVDENYAPSNTSCGTGVCVSTGVTSCVNGVEQNSCAAGSPLSSDDATCDGKDDNCDGSVDEDYAPSNTSCGTGVCASTGVTSCVNGVEQNSCAAGSPLSSDDTTCDGNDDNCDGSVDEDYAPSNTSCGTGVCASTGVTACVNGVEQNSCVAGNPLSSDDATCDGKDDNCDGSVDEDYAPSNTSCGTGVCASTGVTSCVNGVEQNSCVAG